MKIKKYIEFITEAEDDFDFDEETTDEETDDPTDEEGFDEFEEEEEEVDYVSGDTPESYVKGKLSNIKGKIDKMFPEEIEPSGEVTANSDDIDKKIKSEAGEGMSFADLGMNLESSELSKATRTHTNLTVKFSDDTYYYTLLFRIDLKQVTDEELENGEEMTMDMIKKCFIKFKKYKIEGFELLGEISKNIEIDDISEDFLIDLKIELDEEFNGGNEEDFSIEYE